MHPPGLFQLLVIALIVLVLFGRGRISAFMGDFGKGVKTFRRSFADDDEPARPLPVEGPDVASTVEPQPAPDHTGK